MPVNSRLSEGLKHQSETTDVNELIDSLLVKGPLYMDYQRSFLNLIL